MLKSAVPMTVGVCLGLLGLTQPVLARPGVAMPTIEVQPMIKKGQAQMMFRVPDRDVMQTVSGPLRRYDLHMAKMFEVTRASCEQLQPHVDRVEWRYAINGGNLDFGSFVISCPQAQAIARRFGLAGAEPTRLFYQAMQTTAEERIPTLELPFEQRSQFVSTVEQFRPLSIGGPMNSSSVTAIATATPSTEVPITEIRFLPASPNGQARGILVVPDRDPMLSAYGGLLRRYDVHLAKMFEVADLYCANGWSGVEWNYFANNGDKNMGRFVMGCSLVREITSAYGWGRRERTLIASGYGAGAKQEVRNLPVLNITGDKIPKFIQFAQQFRPVGAAQRLDTERR